MVPVMLVLYEAAQEIEMNKQLTKVAPLFALLEGEHTLPASVCVLSRLIESCAPVGCLRLPET